jgi:TRAP-type C4-dicarboxylate transport system permease large subunit
MSSANVVVRIANLSLSLVGHIRGGLSQVRRRLLDVLLGNVGIDHLPTWR